MRTNLLVFLFFTLLFLGFSTLLYLQPATAAGGNSALAGKGTLVWQRYNCQSCHQLYGLGGYLGPDLTNVISEEGKGEFYVIGMIRAGAKQMPPFSLSETEERDLIEFLRSVDRTGSGDPRRFSTSFSGMIERK